MSAKAKKKAAPRPPARIRMGTDVVHWRGTYGATGYHAVRVATRDGRLGTPGSGDSHARNDRKKLLDLSREFYRDLSIYRGLIGRAAQYAVGNGFGLQCRSKSEDWNAEVESWWKRYWRRPEIRGTLSGVGVERVIMREILLCGDTGAIKTNKGKLQLVEAEQIVGPGSSDDGIKRGTFGEPELFYVAPYNKTGMLEVQKASKIKPEDFIYIVDPERPTSLRGIPPAQAAFSNLHRVNDICDSEALAWQLLARMAISVNKTGAGLAGYNTSQQDTTKEEQAADLAARVQMFDGGMIFWGEPGEEVKGIERNIPSQNFTESLTTFLRLIAQAIGLPLEFVFMDWTKSNYSQCRAILEQAFVTFCSWQMLLEDFFHRPVFEWALNRAIEEKEIGQPPSRDDYLDHEWIRPAFPWIDQLKEAQAFGEQVDRGLSTYAAVLKSKNLDRGEVLAIREREVREAIEIAQRIEKETGVKVDWQQFAGAKAAPGAAAGQPVEDEASTDPAEAPKGGRK